MYNLTRKFDFVNNFSDLFQDFAHVETNQPLDLEVDVAGIAAQDISVSIDGSYLIVSGETNGRKVHKTFLIPRNINPDTIEVKYEHGLLHINAQSTKKKVEIKVENKTQ